MADSPVAGRAALVFRALPPRAGGRQGRAVHLAQGGPSLVGCKVVVWWLYGNCTVVLKVGQIQIRGRLWGLFFCCVIYIQRGRDAKLRRELI
jgi:hypothetical protein